MPKARDNFLMDRVVHHEEVPVGQLLAHPDNFRIHSSIQQELVSDSLSGVGWVRRVLVNRLSGRVVDGHLRVSLVMRKMGEDALVPVDYVELDGEEEAYILSMLDESTGMAYINSHKRDALIEKISDAGLRSGMLSTLNKAIDTRRLNLYGAIIQASERDDLLEEIQGEVESNENPQPDDSQDRPAQFEAEFVLDTEQQDEFNSLLARAMYEISENPSEAVLKILRDWRASIHG